MAFDTVQDDLGPLPASDHNRELQELSLRAFRAALPVEAFLFRDERIDDAGVDGSLELLINGRFTNLRAQVQLKSTDAPSTNGDGSVSLAVAVSNINYLLNGASPLYIFYIAPWNELRFVWVRDERKRFDAQNPQWMQQRTVTLRFESVLSGDASQIIHSRICREARMQRSIHDTLSHAGLNEQVVVGVDSQTLATTDPYQMAEVLVNSGITIINSGYALSVIESIATIGPLLAQNPRILLIHGYANYMLGHFQAAIASLAKAALSRHELSMHDQAFVACLRDACDYQTGRIDLDEYSCRKDAWQEQDLSPFRLSYHLQCIRDEFFQELDLRRRIELVEKMREVVEELLSLPEASAAFKMQGRLSLLQLQGFLLQAQAFEEMIPFRMRLTMHNMMSLADIMRSEQEMDDTLRQQGMQWHVRRQAVNKVLQEAYELKHPLLVADALTITVTMEVAYLTSYRLIAAMFGMLWEEISISVEPLRLHLLLQIEDARNIYQQAGQLEGEWNAQMLQADLLILSGEIEAARVIGEDVLPKAQAMDYRRLAVRAYEHSFNSSLIARGVSHLNQVNQSEQFRREKMEDGGYEVENDDDLQTADLSDEKLPLYADQARRMLQLPLERLPILEREYASLRDIARERLEWCQQIELLQDNSHRQHCTTYYSTDPNRSCHCKQYNYKSAESTPDWQKAIIEFKQAYCMGCLSRAPKQIK